MSSVMVVGAATWRGSEPLPSPVLLPASLRRRTSALTRAFVGTVQTLASQTGMDLSRIAVVHGSALGELTLTASLLEALARDDGGLSPTKFHNSVHNTAAGYLSIATGNREFSTSVAAGFATTAMALLEATALIAAGVPEVLVVLAEESVPPLLSSGAKYDALVVALHLGTQASRARIVGPMPISAPPDAVPEALRGNPCAAAWTLAHRIETAQYGRIAIASEPQPWCVDLDPTS